MGILRGVVRATGWSSRVAAPPLALCALFALFLVATRGWGRGWLALAVALVVTAAAGRVPTWVRHRAAPPRPAARAARRRQLASGLLLVAVTVLLVTVCVPTVPRQRVLPPDPSRSLGGSSTTWHLPSGSRVAVYHYPAPRRVGRPATPVLYLAGGPVRSISMPEHQFLAQLASRGRDVWAYEQPGAGRSGLLEQSAYTVDRQLVDLDAVLDRLPGRPVDVIGFSAGGSLLTRALANPGSARRVRRAILADPGPMDGPTAGQQGTTGRATAAGEAPGRDPRRATATPRYLVALGLEMTGLLPLDNGLVGQAEMLNAFSNGDLGGNTASGYCAPDARRIPSDDPGDTFTFNPVAALLVQHSIRSSPSIAVALSHSRTPAMLVMAECSSQVRTWQTTILADDPAIDRVQYLPGVGHHLWGTTVRTHRQLLAVVTAYLDDRPAVLPNYPTRGDIPAFLAAQR